MPDPAEARHLVPNVNQANPTIIPKNSSTPTHSGFVSDGGESAGWMLHHNKPYVRGDPRIVDINVLKRNMSIAKGFMDISLLTANANQLRHLINSGDPSTAVYHIILVGLSLSLILQIATGILLIVKERFDLNYEDDQSSADLYNNITTMFVLLTLLINIFVSSFGIDYMRPRLRYQAAILDRSASGGSGNYILMPNVTTLT